MFPAFQLEIIFGSIKELQQTKAYNEKMLNEVRSKRRSLENKCDQVSTEHAQVTDTNNKMIESLKIAQQKVCQTQNQISRQEDNNETIRQRVKELNQKVQEEETRQAHEIGVFESKLAELAEKFHSAQQYYGPNGLRNEITRIIEDKALLENQASTNEQQAETLATMLSQMKVESGDCQEDEILLETQVITVNMFQDSYKAACNKLKELKDEEKDIQEEFSRISTWVHPGQRSDVRNQNEE
ncbi:uncharacterized protein LOC102801019 [Saccoglossus kowalevskii]|uniref:Leucine-rich repeat-containing protein DDB_G0290503-like n=1 Tax=Saccoglossus kowalevskii TaxID=10224 RepID=A0ABM0MSG3_SACKO|nr:PREDICTED: putative leucine-rich repeat-containing protein DDB_G0290503-like [Saccoglossus kowalevskii]